MRVRERVQWMAGTTLEKCCCDKYVIAKYCDTLADSDVLIRASEATEPTIFTVSGDNCTGYYIDETLTQYSENPDPDNMQLKSVHQVYERCVDIKVQCNDCQACMWQNGDIPRWMRVHISGLEPCGEASNCSGPTSVTVDLPYRGNCQWYMDYPYPIRGCNSNVNWINGDYPAFIICEVTRDYVGVYWGYNADCNNVFSWAEYFTEANQPSPPDCDPAFNYSMAITPDQYCPHTCLYPGGQCWYLSRAFFRLTKCTGSVSITSVQ